MFGCLCVRLQVCVRVRVFDVYACARRAWCGRMRVCMCVCACVFMQLHNNVRF